MKSPAISASVLHHSLGSNTNLADALMLAFHLLSGLAWVDIWGAKFVHSWSTFPAEKGDMVPWSDETHASMKHTAHDKAPWPLELIPRPQSGWQAGAQLLPVGTSVGLETISARTRALGFDARVLITAPADSTGVRLLSHDSTSYDNAERSVHIHQHASGTLDSGLRILAAVQFADDPVGDRASPCTKARWACGTSC